MKRGEVYWVDFRATGAETQKRRPAVLVSNNGANRAGPVVQFVPLTTNVVRVFPWDALVRVDGDEVRAMCNQIQSADLSRIGEFKAALSDEDMRRVDQALRIQLALA